MKAEHRHELKTNDLSKALITTGDYVREYGGRVALALAVVIMVVVLVNTRVKRGRETAVRVKSDLAYAQAQVDQISAVGVDRLGVPSVSVEQIEIVRDTLRRVQDDASDDKVIAQALVAEADLNWGLANYPEFGAKSPATTRSAYKLQKDRAEYLKEAAELYKQVIDRYGDQTLPVVTARFGLAAIAEQNRNWDEARSQYEAVTKLPDEAKTFKQLAEARTKRLGEISQPVLIGQIPERPAIPEPDPFDLDSPGTTRPGVSTTRSTAAPSTQVAPTTQRAATQGGAGKP